MKTQLKLLKAGARFVRRLSARRCGWVAALALLTFAFGQSALQAQTPIVTATTTDNVAVINSTNYATIQVTRTGNTSSPLTVWYWWVGNATTWDDYRFLDDTTSDNVTIPAGQSSVTLTLKATGVNNAGEPETAGIQIVTRPGYEAGSPDTAMFDIYTTEPVNPTVTATATDNTAVINSTNYATLQITRSGSTSSPLTVWYWWVGNATTWDDYRFLDDTTSDHVTIPAGQSSVTLTLKATGANNASEPETGGIQIVSRPGYEAGSPDTAMFNIYSVDPGQQQAATPTFNPAAGSYNSPQSVTISTATSGATIHFTQDGSTPTTASAVYSGPIVVSSTTTLRAIAAAPGYATSAVGAATYTFGQSSQPGAPIVEVRTAAPTVIAVVVQTPITYEQGGANSSPDGLDLSLANWRVDGASPAAIHRYSIPWDELPATEWNDPNHPNSFPVTTRHRIYLQLNSALVEGHNYSITTPYGNTSFVFNSRNTFCESIKVNQVGYSKLSTSRFANFGVYMGDGGTMTFSPLPAYQVINESTGAVVASGTAVDMGDDTGTSVPNSGEHVYRLSLNAVPEGGPYFVSIAGAGRSRPFGIGDAYSAQIANVTLRGFYHHRCGMALTQPYTAFTHASCHNQIAYGVRSTSPQDEVVVPPGSPTSHIEGGYHDAGDMDHTEGHPLISILMLSFFDAFPTHFVDNQYNIPESGNGVPDFLDEVMWGVKLWENLQIVNTSDAEYGGVMSGWSTQGATGYGSESAASDTHAYGTKNVQEECTALCAGIFAQASRLIRPYDSAKADALLNRAQLAWGYLTTHSNVNLPQTRFLYAALQLYLATGNSTYHDVFKAAANNLIVNGGGTGWPEAYLPGNSSATCQTAHFVSYLIPNGRSTDATLVQALKNKLLSYADSESYMGPPPENAPYPQGVTKFLAWGAGTAQGRYADVWMYGSLFTTDPVKKQNYINAVCQYADFSLGLNPMGMSYYTGLGVDQPNSPLDCNSYFTKYGLSDGVTADTHRDSAGNPIGNVPGILVYGPTEGRSGLDYETAVSNKLYPAWDNLPPQRRYAHGWSLIHGNEFTVSETMTWNVVMYAFLYTP
jgi:endoglucanase